MKLGDFTRGDAGMLGPKRLADAFNDTRTEYPRDRTVHAVFAQRAAERPDAAAVLHGERTYSYREVEGASNRFARFLAAQSVRPEAPVAVMLDAPFENAATLLGILKSGGAYLPLDPEAPFDRLRHMIEDSGARVLVTEKRHIRQANRLQWECLHLDALFCADSRDVRAEPEGIGGMSREALWDHVGSTAFDDISGGGWTSSYTGAWLSREVMDGYGENVRAKLRPYLTTASRVLEIGCGSGISLLRLAPLAASYVATDLSRQILDYAGQEAERAGLRNVRLEHCRADETGTLAETGFDVAVLNSVIQCFSGYNTLRSVLRQAIARMTGRGVVFLSNLWDLEKKEEFIRSLTRFREENAGRGFRTKTDCSEDLFVSRDFLEDLRHDLPEIARIECSGMLGNARSELSEYGYDALLFIDKAGGGTPPRPRRKFQFDVATLDCLEDGPLPEATGPRGLAYIMYTSGTSGRPKGVMVEHRAIVRLVRGMTYARLGPEDRILQTGSPAFDASTFEIWGALLNGGALCRPPKTAVLDAAELARLIAKHGITTLFLTTGLFNQHVDTDVGLFTGLQQLLFGGERVSASHVNMVRRRHPRLAVIHAYGPTENTTFTTCHRIDREYAGSVPIGRPISNTQVLIMDADGAPVPVGIAGEICAAGDGLARGYLHDPELTRQKFVPHPWQSGERMYRTGDQGLWRADGTIEYLGRTDDQVKIRGYRVEPAEVAQCILQDPAIGEALVLGREAGGGGLELVAYLTAAPGGPPPDPGELRQRLKQSLPEQMVPAHLILLERMPLNANGKADRSKLPNPAGPCMTSGAPHKAPATETERLLVAIWEEVLGRTGLGATDDFFESGGHSLKVAKAVSLIQQRAGVSIPLAAFFTRPTPRALAGHLVDSARFGVASLDDAMVPLHVPAAAGVRNLFAFPPGTGDALGYVQLAGLLPYRFYGFNFIEPETRLHDYANQIERVDPEGPYVLFGYSSGGNLAYHVARELEARGRRVAGIVMVDSARKLERMPMSEAEIERITAGFLGDGFDQLYGSSPVMQEKARRAVRSSLRYVEAAVDRHVIDAGIQVLTGEDSIAEYRDADGRLIISEAGWADVTRGRLSTRAGVGPHNHMLAQPYLDRNAELIREMIDSLVQ